MTTPSFRRLAQMSSQDLVLKPTLETYLHEAKFPDVFSVTFRKAGLPREPDDWFHPSTHPLMTERQLLLYLTHPSQWEVEQLSYESRMAVTMGTSVHAFFQMCMIDAGILIRPQGVCVNCGRQHGANKKSQCNEFGVIDRDLGRRGHMDGLISIDPWGVGVMEFKTINPRAAVGLNDHNLDWLKTKHFDYYAQIQEYLDMTGQSRAILLFCILGYPWKLVEIEVPYDLALATQTKAKYRRVRRAQQDWVDGKDALSMVDPCCAPRSAMSKVCPARMSCPIGVM